MENTVIKIE